jgi:hypothetical protein
MTDSAFSFVTHWQKSELAGDDAKVVEFWKAEGALANDVKADERLRQVILHAETAEGEVAAVSTAFPMTLPRLGQPMYYFRCFVGKKWRGTRLVLRVLARSAEVLEAYARENKFPCVGVLLELENARFAETLQQPIWPSTKFVYIGKSQRNLDLRVRYFRGARLKKPKI